MNERDGKIYDQLDGQAKGLYQLLSRKIDDKFEELNSNIASLSALLVTITNSETFKKIIEKEIEAHTKEQKDD